MGGGRALALVSFDARPTGKPNSTHVSKISQTRYLGKQQWDPLVIVLSSHEASTLQEASCSPLEAVCITFYRKNTISSIHEGLEGITTVGYVIY